MTEVLQLPHGRLTHYGKAQGFSKPALVICPGGGYEFCSIREGAPVARAFARDGIEAFVLEYDCVPVPLGTMPVLCYPVVSAGEHAHRGSFVQLAGAERDKQQVFSLEYLVDGDMPPTFLWHTLDDDEVPVENTLLLEQALRRAGVPHEVHLFPHGIHGLSLADFETYEPTRGRLPDRHVNRWQALCAEWLKNLG